jgi:hypothetical protein
VFFVTGERDRTVELPEGVLAVRAGPGANCSSIGSVIDLLFGTAIVAGAVYAAIAAALPDVPDRPIELTGEGDDQPPKDAP